MMKMKSKNESRPQSFALPSMDFGMMYHDVDIVQIVELLCSLCLTVL